MNLILLIVLLLIAPLIIPIVSDIAVPIVGGLNESFVDMNNATIVRTIPVNDQMPIQFTLPLSQTTDVVVLHPVELQNVPTRFVLAGGGGTIEGTVTLALPEGLKLPVALSMEVPVEQTIPVQLAVDVEIPLNETDLGPPFDRLEGLFTPIDGMLKKLPATNSELFSRVVSGEKPVPVENTAVLPPGP